MMENICADAAGKQNRRSDDGEHMCCVVGMTENTPVDVVGKQNRHSDNREYMYYCSRLPAC
jgi:hypothetical protein